MPQVKLSRFPDTIAHHYVTPEVLVCFLCEKCNLPWFDTADRFYLCYLSYKEFAVALIEHLDRLRVTGDWHIEVVNDYKTMLPTEGNE